MFERKTLITKAGDRLYWDENTLLAELVLEPCSGHPSGAICRECLPRFSALVELAKECFDPQVRPQVNWLNGIQVADYPPRCVLVKPKVGGGFELKHEGFDVRYEGGVRISSSKRIPTGSLQRRPSDFPSSIVLFDHIVDIPTTNSLLLRDFTVSLPEEMDPEYRQHLLEAVLDLSVDGESVVSDLSLREALRLGRIPLAVFADVLLYGAQKADGDLPGEKPSVDGDPIGYMLPHGTRIRLSIQGVPLGGGLIRIDSLFEPGNYTAKANRSPVRAPKRPVP